jgi:hypothetical protein
MLVSVWQFDVVRRMQDIQKIRKIFMRLCFFEAMILKQVQYPDIQMQSLLQLFCRRKPCFL